MRKTRLLAITCAAFCAAAVAGPFDAFKGKMKEGLYEYKMEMDMGNIPGMPAGMKSHTTTFQKCVTHRDVEGGDFAKGNEHKGPQNCEIQDLNMSGNTATYKMVCKGREGRGDMTAENKIAFSDSGFKMDMKMAMDQGGRMVNMTQKMESRYLGPCTK